LLIQGAKSAVMTAHRRKDPISLWLVQRKERVGWQKAAVALANNPNHVPKRSAAYQEVAEI
jgi:hypothetical protein